jgi:hypothetical protein
MRDNLIPAAQSTGLVIRCQCGTIVMAEKQQALIDLVRLHLSEFHPDLGGNIPADLILAMAEE